jgi:PKD repeat protein
MTGAKKSTGNAFSLLFTAAVICLMTTAIISGVRGVSPVNLGSADSFVILSESGIGDTPISHITGNVGTSPITGAAISGLTCAEVTGAIYATDATGPAPCSVEDPALLIPAVTDMENAYAAAQGLPSPDFTDTGAGELGGLTLVPGIYRFTSAVKISGDLVLDGKGDANSVWIFQIPGTSALGIDANRNVILRGGARADNVFWVVGGATTLGTGSGFNGTILDLTAITLGTGAKVNGRALAQSAVTLNGNTMDVPAVIAAPVADFTFTNASGTEPLDVAFTDASTPAGNIAQWAWDFGDGTNATVQNPVHTYDTAGLYPVNLTVTDQTGATSTKIETDAVTVNPVPVADFTFTNASGTEPLDVAFTDTSTPAGNIAHWAWDFGDDTNTTVQNPVHTYDTAGLYSVNLTVTDKAGATATKIETDAVTVNPVPVADFTFTNASGIVPLDVAFTDTSTPAGNIAQWAWDFGDGSNATDRNPVHHYNAIGVYPVNLTVTDKAGVHATKMVTDAVTVIRAGPVANFTFTPASGPARLTVVFNDTSTPADQIASWLWDFGDGSTTNFTARNPVHTYAAPGLYSVHLTVTDGHAAHDTRIAVNVINVGPPLFEITLINVPVSLALNPGETTTSTDAQFTVNSTTDWQVTAKDADGGTLGYMTGYSGSGYLVPVTRLGQPFKILDSTDSYVALPSGADAAVTVKTGTPDMSGTAYPLGIQQDVRVTDQVLPSPDVYRIVVTLTVGSI